MELRSTLDYKGYTIKTFDSARKEVVKIFLDEEPIDYDPGMDVQYEGSRYDEKGVNAAKQHIDELEEKENSL